MPKCMVSSFSHFILFRRTKHDILSYNSTFLKIIGKWVFMLTSFIIFIIKSLIDKPNNLDFLIEFLLSLTRNMYPQSEISSKNEMKYWYPFKIRVENSPHISMNDFKKPLTPYWSSSFCLHHHCFTFHTICKVIL